MAKSRNRSRDAKKRAKKKRLAREKLLNNSNKGVDWDKVPEVMQPSEYPLYMKNALEED